MRTIWSFPRSEQLRNRSFAESFASIEESDATSLWSSILTTGIRGRVVTRWPGSQEVRGSIPAATKIVTCKNLAFNIGECVFHGSDTT